MTEQHDHVALVFDRPQGRLLALAGRLLGQRLRGLQHGLFHLDQSPHLGRQLGDLQPAQQVLPLDRELDDDLANLVAGFVEPRLAFGRRPVLSLDQDVDHVQHFGFDQFVDVLPHADDLGVDRQLVQPVFLELLDLDVEDAARSAPWPCRGRRCWASCLLRKASGVRESDWFARAAPVSAARRLAAGSTESSQRQETVAVNVASCSFRFSDTELSFDNGVKLAGRTFVRLRNSRQNAAFVRDLKHNGSLEADCPARSRDSRSLRA